MTIYQGYPLSYLGAFKLEVLQINYVSIAD